MRRDISHALVSTKACPQVYNWEETQNREGTLMSKSMTAIALTVPLLAGAAIAADGGSHEPIRIALSGAQEDPTVITGGRGTAVLRINGNTISFRVRYSNLVTAVQQAHIHIGAADTTGGIAAFLCTNLSGGPAGTPPCPPAPGEITGVIDAADVLDVPAQGVPAGSIAALITALRNGLAYVNIHTLVSPMGEIRGDVPSQHHN